MTFFKLRKDGGPESHVWGYFLFELKRFATVVLLRFEDVTRDAYHTHAFDAVSWVLRGRLAERHLDGRVVVHAPSLRPVLTYRETFHQVHSSGRSWVLSFRGPWVATWAEYLPAVRQHTLLRDGRRVV